VLDRELRRHCGVNLDGVIGPVIDPFCIDKHLDPYRRGRCDRGGPTRQDPTRKEPPQHER
jgi:DNA polymerase III subunit epsilon